MRSILLCITLCLISSVSWGQTALWTDLFENPGDDLAYEKFLTMPFTGTVSAAAADPFQRSYKDGSKHGEWVELDINLLIGSKSVIEDGILQSKTDFEDGIQAIGEDYYERGRL